MEKFDIEYLSQLASWSFFLEKFTLGVLTFLRILLEILFFALTISGISLMLVAKFWPERFFAIEKEIGVEAKRQSQLREKSLS